MANILTFKDVSKVFMSPTSETLAVSNLSFEVEQGDFVALIGPSGCGKSTILSLICNLIQPSSGTIEVPRQEIGYMLQRDSLFEWRTIMDNVKLGLEVQHKLTATNVDKANELLRKYGLWEFRKHKPSELSGGMRQRVALIRTLATNPSLLLLDEPFSALDFQTRLQVCDDVYKIIKSENKTALLVTHDINEAISLANKIIVLTKRPATVKAIHYTNLDNYPTPLLRREAPTFSSQFEILHNYLLGENNA